MDKNSEILIIEGNTYTDRQIKEAFSETGGNVALSAKKLGCTVQALYYRLRKNVELRLALEEAREVQLDEADYRLQNAVRRDEAWAIQFTLRTLGRKRGYGDSLTIEAIPKMEIPLDNWSTEDLKIQEELAKKYQLDEGEKEDEII